MYLVIYIVICINHLTPVGIQKYAKHAFHIVQKKLWTLFLKTSTITPNNFNILCVNIARLWGMFLGDSPIFITIIFFERVCCIYFCKKLGYIKTTTSAMASICWSTFLITCIVIAWTLDFYRIAMFFLWNPFLELLPYSRSYLLFVYAQSTFWHVPGTNKNRLRWRFLRDYNFSPFVRNSR